MGGKGSLDEDSLSKEFENKVLISDKARVTKAKNNAVDNKITIMTINVQNSGGVAASERRLHYKNLINEKNPHVILSQECNQTDLNNVKSLGQYTYWYTPLNNYLYEATILLKQDQVGSDESFQQIKVNKSIAPTDKTINPSNDIGDLINNRLALGRVKIGERWLYIGSWHGPWKKPVGEGKLTDCMKEEVFKELRKFMSEFVCMDGDKVNHHPWIVGGDFNIEHYKVKKHLGGNAKIVHTFDNIIYYLCHPGLFGCVEEVASYMVESKVLSTNGNPDKVYFILDHKPAMLTIDMTNYEKEVDKVEIERKRKEKADK